MNPRTESPGSTGKELRDLFQSFDKDGDGRIDRHEFGALLEILGAGLSQAEAAHAFSDIDADASGRIDFDEFRRFWRVEP